MMPVWRFSRIDSYFEMLFKTARLMLNSLEVLALISCPNSGGEFPCMTFHLLHLGTFMHILSVFSRLLNEEIVAVPQKSVG